MRVRFRSYCYGCRRGPSWDGPCIWSRHRRTWEYIITCDGVRLYTSGPFKTIERARASARRSWVKISALSCVTERIS